ncbi:conserved protein, unknown function [Babesia microti strain RI]|uniref:Uncharacterized protein n=1 Tax=Babesia microti (strain RI) TaxID=1133968 RepID=I7J529_BABMR|nr:conserved protein, unknown function [Babesia microti strain RI]CCF72487.1 conserved protein, unknown function [Babesia microti strain RI]|eukprot:XP_012647096.1 conserved protein, unknown function [Babesia microti strain RI]
MTVKSDAVSKPEKVAVRQKKIKGPGGENDDQTLDLEDELLERRLFKKGQKYPTPPLGDGTRAFYESLLEENPHSPIAIKFCLEHGIFGERKHEQLRILYNELRDNGILNAPVGGLTLQTKHAPA